MKEINKTFLVRKLEHKDTRKVMAKGDKSKRSTHSLEGIGQDGGNRIKLTNPEGFDGVNEGDIIDIVIKNSQTSINDFTGFKEPKKKT